VQARPEVAARAALGLAPDRHVPQQCRAAQVVGEDARPDGPSLGQRPPHRYPGRAGLREVADDLRSSRLTILRYWRYCAVVISPSVATTRAIAGVGRALLIARTSRSPGAGATRVEVVNPQHQQSGQLEQTRP
jgi:hypothetical protein